MKLFNNISLFFLFFLSISNSVFGQVDTVLNMAEIHVSAHKIRTAPIGTQAVEWNTQKLEQINAQNVAELLNNETPIFIKSYGLGSLATSSIRGGSAGHTLVLWNGLPIQSPMLGQLDLSLLPLNATEEITLQKGGNSALWGSGAIGGVISLQNQPDFSNKISAQSGTLFGSFGTFEEQLKLNLGNEKLQSSSKVFYNHTNNDFSYSISPSLPKKTQTNANLSQWNFLQDIYWKINRKNRIDAHFWRQYSKREIPPLTTQNQSLAHQDDIATRLLLNWQRIDNQSVLNGKIGFSDEHNNYFDEIILLEARNRFKSLIGEINFQKALRSNQKIFLGGTHSITKAWSDGYVNPSVENRTALFTSYQFFQSKFQAQISLRQEIANDQWVPIVPSFGANVKLNRYLNWQFKVGKNYRLPTLNDRFWNPGGNPDLLPESGWSYESTISTDFNAKNLDFKIALTGFNRTIKNQILWIPLEGEPFWSPHNISKVWSRGLESYFSIFYQNEHLNIALQGGYDFIRASNQTSLTLPKIEKGEQVIYTPKHQTFGKFSLTWKKIQLAYRHSFTGKTSGVNEILTSYQTGDIRLQSSTKLGSSKGSIFFNVNNLWDTPYFVIERRPMAGRYFQIGLNIQFISK
jgi:iron complex outermembrane receptor protein